MLKSNFGRGALLPWTPHQRVAPGPHWEPCGSNRAQNIKDVYVPCYAISDHYPVCLTHKLSHCKDKELDHKTITYRAMKHFDEDQFLLDLECQPWFLLNSYDDPNDAMDFFNALKKC